MPGVASHTSGTALTARLAVYPGVVSAMCSERDRQPDVDVQGAVTVDDHPPSPGAKIPPRVDLRRAVPGGAEREEHRSFTEGGHGHPLGGHRASGDVAGGDLDVPDGRGHLSGRLDRIDGHAESVPHQSKGRSEGMCTVGPSTGVEAGGMVGESHQLEEQLWRVPARQIGKLLDPQAVQTTLE